MTDKPKDKQLIFVLFLLAVLGSAALYLYLMSEGFDLNRLRLFNKDASTVIVEEGQIGKIKLTSKAFVDGASIPAKNTCSGVDLSPPLSITNIPEGTKSLTIIVDDPDSPYKVWTHWIVYNIDPRTKEIYEGVMPWNAISGENDFGVAKYQGPCPPVGQHKYVFKVYALDKKLDLETGAKRQEVEKAMEGHVLDTGELTGVFEK